MIMKKCTMYPWKHSWLPLTQEAHKTGGATDSEASAATRNYKMIHELYTLYTSSSSNMICLWSNTAGVIDGNNWSRKVTVNHTWFSTVLFSTTFYCVSWSLHQLTEAFVLTVYLMPYLLLSHWMCLADLPNLRVHFLCPSVQEQEFTINYRSLWCEKQSTIHTCDKRCIKDLYVKYQY